MPGHVSEEYQPGSSCHGDSCQAEQLVCSRGDRQGVSSSLCGDNKLQRMRSLTRCTRGSSGVVGGAALRLWGLPDVLSPPMAAALPARQAFLCESVLS